MPTVALYSTCTASVDYDESDQTLMIMFHRGGQGTYIYEDVPPEVYAEFMNAGSKGSYFNSHIRNEYTFR